MRGIPSFTEELLVGKYVQLLKYTGSSIHITGVSSKVSVKLIEDAKKEGLSISADTSIYNLLFTDEKLKSFDTNFKLNPPLREESDRQALLSAVRAGIIDVVTAGHEPHEEDAKKCELKTASFGVIGIQTFFPLLLKEFEIEEAVSILTSGNRKAFNVEVPQIQEGVRANLTLFNPTRNWHFDAATNQSKSVNSMFFGKELTGDIIGVISGQQFLLR